MSTKQKCKIMSFGRGYGPAKAAGETARFKAKKQHLAEAEGLKEAGVSGWDNLAEPPEAIWKYPHWVVGGKVI